MPPTQDNRITNNLVAQGKLPASQAEVFPQTNNDALQAEIQANPQGEASKARFRRPPVNPSVSASAIANPPQPVTIPQPVVAPLPSQFVNNTLDPVIQNSNDGIIRAQTQETEDRGNLMNQISALGEDTNFRTNTFNDTFRDNFSTDQQRQREDATLKLAQLQGKFRTDKAAQVGTGLTSEESGANIGELSRREAVEVGNQALLVQALNGNMESARQIALDTANFANQDRQAELDNLITQYNALDGIVTGQEKQLVDQAKAKALAEKEELQRTQATTDSAILSGGATVEEMQQLTSTTATNEEKLALSQSILARTTGEDRDLQRANTRSLIGGRDGSGGGNVPGTDITFDTADDLIAKNPELASFEAFIENKEAKLQQTIADPESFREEYQALVKEKITDVETSQREEAVNSLSPVSKTAFLEPELFFTLTATQKGEIIEEVAGAGLDATSLQSGKKTKLSSTQADNLAQGQLALRNVTRIGELFEELGATGPGIGQFRNANPLDDRVVELNQLITQTVPGLARGIFKEVGVLTDMDVERYTGTLSNAKLTNEQANTANENLIELINDSMDIQFDTFSNLGYDLNDFTVGDSKQEEEDQLSDTDAYAAYLNTR